MINFRNDSTVELIDSMASDDATAMSAWVSFGRDQEDRLENRSQVKGLINFLYRNRHMTPFESSLFTFRVTTPIFVAREYFRHRSASYNEWSGRYAEMIPDFYIPGRERPLVQAGKPGDYYFVPGDNNQYELVRSEQETQCTNAWNSYQRQLKAGVAKEVARNILPLSTYTRFYATMNARNLMHFLGLRNESHALYEIQEVARGMESYLEQKMPYAYEAYVEGRNGN